MAIYGWALTKFLGQHMTRVLILGGGFAGLNAAKVFAGAKGIELIIIDQKNYHLFQPLLLRRRH